MNLLNLSRFIPSGICLFLICLFLSCSKDAAIDDETHLAQIESRADVCDFSMTMDVEIVMRQIPVNIEDTSSMNFLDKTAAFPSVDRQFVEVCHNSDGSYDWTITPKDPASPLDIDYLAPPDDLPRTVSASVRDGRMFLYSKEREVLFDGEINLSSMNDYVRFLLETTNREDKFRSFLSDISSTAELTEISEGVFRVAKLDVVTNETSVLFVNEPDQLFLGSELYDKYGILKERNIFNYTCSMDGDPPKVSSFISSYYSLTRKSQIPVVTQMSGYFHEFDYSF